MKRFFSIPLHFILIAVLGLSIVIQSCSSDNNSENKASAEATNATEAEQTNRPARTGGAFGKAPEFELMNLKGEPVKLSDFEGKVVLLNFWATWCGPCRREIPDLIKLQNEYKQKGFEIIGVALDEEGAEVVAPYAEEFGINYTLVLDDYTYGDKIGGIYMVPTTYIIGRDGEIKARKIGEISIEDIENRVKALL